ncbi:SMODS domain-containing nucleotidyltransferase [Mycoplasma todarodis]|uniref:SMODS domain-containing nucleotidyltransferase n=1 Tax=Mycoplasma todarodis TaxID=1937191 RepID=UPI003B2FC99B
MIINTKNINKSLNQFAKDNKLSDGVYEQIRGRRKTIERFLEEYINGNGNKVIEKFHLGSYQIRTGVMYHDNDFDIDYAFVLKDENGVRELRRKVEPWLRGRLKDHYKMPIRVENNKNALTVKFYRKENGVLKQIFHLDIPFYVKKNDKYFHLKRDDFDNYNLIETEPKKTFNRQKDALNEANGMNNKRNAIILLKYLRSRNHIKGITSIYITDRIIEQNEKEDTFLLMKNFFENPAIGNYNLKEKPQTNLIKDINEFNETRKELKKMFIGEDTIEVYNKLNSKFDNKLKALPIEEGEEKIENHFGG